MKTRHVDDSSEKDSRWLIKLFPRLWFPWSQTAIRVPISVSQGGAGIKYTRWVELHFVFAYFPVQIMNIMSHCPLIMISVDCITAKHMIGICCVFMVLTVTQMVTYRMCILVFSLLLNPPKPSPSFSSTAHHKHCNYGGILTTGLAQLTEHIKAEARSAVSIPQTLKNDNRTPSTSNKRGDRQTSWRWGDWWWKKKWD